MPTDHRPLTIFLSYSHKDERLKDDLAAHLSAMRQAGLIAQWHDRKILPGDNWSAEIDENLARSDIFIALVSADFIASNYCWGVELAKALEQQERGVTIVVPVIVRPVDWQRTPLGRFQALPQDGRPVTVWNNRDKAWTDVAIGLRYLVEALRSSAPGEASTLAAVRPSPGTESVEFAHVSTTPERAPQWRELSHEGQDCPLGPGCSRYFKLEPFVFDADLFLDVTVLNDARSPRVISAVGVEFLEAVHIIYVYGFPVAAKIAPPTDEYVLEMPNIRALLPEDAGWLAEPAPFSVDKQVWTRLPDPIYLPSAAPYRYLLRFAGYQRNVPNHARLRLLVESGGDVTRSQTLHVFTW
jgi:hypothetical protein